MDAALALLIAAGALAGVWLAFKAVMRPRSGLERAIGVLALVGAGLGFLMGITT